MTKEKIQVGRQKKEECGKLLEDRRRAGDGRTDQRIKERVIQKKMRGKIKEMLRKNREE